MAADAEARALTAAHKAAQSRIGARAAARSLGLWSLLNLADLDTSATVWTPVHVSAMQAEFRASQELAERYLTEARRMQPTTDPGRIVAASFNTSQAVVAARVSGPVAVKSLIAGGMDPIEAFTSAQAGAAGRMQKWAVAGGRALIVNSAQASRRRTWRRVTDGHPCAFCAMLVAHSITYGAQPGSARFHEFCGCTIEEIYADQDEPTDVEDEFVNAYYEAAKQATAAGEPRVIPHRRPSGSRETRDTILWRMRRNRPDLFHDGVTAT